MKESGINYFFSGLGLNSGTFGVLYTFEDGAGVKLSSVPVANPIYSGTVVNGGSFWTKPGSGFFTGGYVNVNNAVGLYSPAFTHLFSYERVGTSDMTLLSSLTGQTGYQIGITPTNKPYFKSMTNGDPVVAASYNNYSSKNLIAVAYVTNHLSISYYNWNAKTFETESFDYVFGAAESDTWTLGRDYTGYMDYYAYFSDYLSTNALNELASGLYNIPTGYGLPVETVCTNTVTGYATIVFSITGVTGYSIIPTGFADGVGEFTGVFPQSNVQTAITGILSSGYYQSGISGLQCINYTGSPIPLYNVLNGYAGSFGMEKVTLLNYIRTGDVVKYSNSLVPFDDRYNKTTVFMYSGFNTVIPYSTGVLGLDYNGLAILATQDWFGTGKYLYVSGADFSDHIWFDTVTGGRQIVTGAPYTLTYTGQEVYLNGLNLISGLDFTYNGTTLTLTGANTGVSGTVWTYPVIRAFTTGNFSLITGIDFSRNTSFVYVNGLRQMNRLDFIEGSLYDRLTVNLFNENGNVEVYDNNGEFWE